MTKDEEHDVRLLLQCFVYLDWVMSNDEVIGKSSWEKQVGGAERAALQRLIETVKL